MWLIAGLGNPGSKYSGTRHNAGFLVLDRFLLRHGAGIAGARFDAQVGELQLGDDRILLLKPQTWMNESGRSLGAALRYYKAQPEQLLVIHDEVDLPFGMLRLKAGGGAGGHNGLKSTTQHIGSPDYLRLRFGIGRGPGTRVGGDLTPHVLGRFSGTEQARLDDLLDDAVDGLDAVIQRGIIEAMNGFNRKVGTSDLNP